MNLERYTHLVTLQRILLFHQPRADQYNHVRKIAERKPGDGLGLVALANYRRQEDIELIRSGFKADHGNGNNNFFFLAIENFPHQNFKQELIACSKEKGREDYMIENSYYLRALAAYKDKECLRILEDYTAQKIDSSSYDPYALPFIKVERLNRIYYALKKHYTPMYDSLMYDIRKALGNDLTDKPWDDHWMETDPWNYTKA